MNIIKNSLVESLVNTSLHKLEELSLKIAESSMVTCCSLGGFYEPQFPKELLSLEEE